MRFAQLDNPGDEFVDVLPAALTLLGDPALPGGSDATAFGVATLADIPTLDQLGLLLLVLLLSGSALYLFRR